MYLSIYVSFFLSLSLYININIISKCFFDPKRISVYPKGISVYLSIYVSLSFFFFLSLSLSLHIYLYIYSLSLPTYLSSQTNCVYCTVCVCVCIIYIYLSTLYLSLFRSTYLSIQTNCVYCTAWLCPDACGGKDNTFLNFVATMTSVALEFFATNFMEWLEYARLFFFVTRHSLVLSCPSFALVGKA